MLATSAAAVIAGIDPSQGYKAGAGLGAGPGFSRGPGRGGAAAEMLPPGLAPSGGQTPALAAAAPAALAAKHPGGYTASGGIFPLPLSTYPGSVN